jgi:hypothetical protein
MTSEVVASLAAEMLTRYEALERLYDELHNKLRETSTKIHVIESSIGSYISRVTLQEAEQGKFDAPHWSHTFCPTEETDIIPPSALILLLRAHGEWIYAFDLISDEVDLYTPEQARWFTPVYRRIINVEWVSDVPE